MLIKSYQIFKTIRNQLNYLVVTTSTPTICFSIPSYDVYLVNAVRFIYDFAYCIDYLTIAKYFNYFQMSGYFFFFSEGSSDYSH